MNALESAAPAHFESLYAASADPWLVETSWYERRKAALLLAALPREHYRQIFEPACGVGVLTRQLADRCDNLLAVDASAHALRHAAVRLSGYPHVRLRQCLLPVDWPGPDLEVDLVVLSEWLYYLSPSELDLVAQLLRERCPRADVVACHFRLPFDDRHLSTLAIHACVATALGRPADTQLRDTMFQLDIWSCDAARARGGEWPS